MNGGERDDHLPVVWDGERRDGPLLRGVRHGVDAGLHSCGASLRPGAKFCHECGTAVASGDSGGGGAARDGAGVQRDGGPGIR